MTKTIFKYLFIFCLIFSFFSTSFAEKKVRKIFLEHSDKLLFDKNKAPDYQLLVGHVHFSHDSASMYCDSARFYQKKNSLFAYGNVRMEQGDSLFIYADRFYYDGNTKQMRLRNNVVLKNTTVTLNTDSLNYDRVKNIGYFLNGGVMQDTLNTLASKYGQYNTITKVADFRDSVLLTHPKFNMTGEQLLYNTSNKVSTITKPTRIKFQDGYIDTSHGWYNTSTEISNLFDRSTIINNHRLLTADTLIYQRNEGIGVGFGNMFLYDSLKTVSVKGDYGYTNESKEYFFLTKKAHMIKYSSTDTIYLHADTITGYKDSIFNVAKAYHNVRIFSNDMQGLCDSIYFSSSDSIMHMFTRPILWIQGQQLTGQKIQFEIKNNKLDNMEVDGDALIVQHMKDSLYNQIGGKELIAYFDDSTKVDKIKIRGNVEVIYLPKDKSKNIIGFNRLLSSSLNVFMKDGKMEKMTVWPSPKGKFYPLELLPPDQVFLSSFVWYDYLRPISSDDIFRRTKFKITDAELNASGVRRTNKK